MFNDHELELLISGLPEIDVDDLRGNTDYTGYTPAARQIQWFWEIVAALSKEDLALLVQFVTGTSKVPLEGFKALQVRQSVGLSAAQAIACGLCNWKHPENPLISRHQIIIAFGKPLSTACRTPWTFQTTQPIEPLLELTVIISCHHPCCATRHLVAELTWE